MITKKSKGGKGKKETIRNEAIVTLRKANPNIFKIKTLAKLFERDRQVIRQVLERENGIVQPVDK